MVRSRSQKAIQSEARVKDALNQTKGKNRKTGYQAAKTLVHSTSTVYRRLNGGKSRAEARESQQLLHDYEEKALVVWITMMAAIGNPVSQAFVREMTEDIRKQRLIGINDESMTLIEYPPIEVVRIKEVSSKLTSQFFDVFIQVLNELDIQ
jgi:hypothetical protein